MSPRGIPKVPKANPCYEPEATKHKIPRPQKSTRTYWQTEFDADYIRDELLAYLKLCAEGKIIRPTIVDFRVFYFGKSRDIAPICNNTLYRYAADNTCIRELLDVLKDYEWIGLRNKADDGITPAGWAKYRAYNLGIGMRSEDLVVAEQMNKETTVQTHNISLHTLTDEQLDALTKERLHGQGDKDSMARGTALPRATEGEDE